MKNWESLIASRMRPCVTICKIEDAGKRNQRMCEKRWRKNNPEKVKEIQKRSDEKRKNDPARIAYKREYNKRYTTLIGRLHPTETPKGEWV